MTYDWEGTYWNLRTQHDGSVQTQQNGDQFGALITMLIRDTGLIRAYEWTKVNVSPENWKQWQDNSGNNFNGECEALAFTAIFNYRLL